MLHGALTCYELPTLEQNAGFSPSFALHHRSYEYAQIEGRLVLSFSVDANKDKVRDIEKHGRPSM